MKKAISLVIPWHVFPFEVMVCLGMDKEEVLKELEKYYIPDDEKEYVKMEGRGKTIMFKGGETLIWMENYPRPGSGVLAHECFHAIYFLLDKIGITIDGSSDELVAYMLEYLTNEIHKKLKA